LAAAVPGVLPASNGPASDTEPELEPPDELFPASSPPEDDPPEDEPPEDPPDDDPRPPDEEDPPVEEPPEDDPPDEEPLDDEPLEEEPALDEEPVGVDPLDPDEDELEEDDPDEGAGGPPSPVSDELLLHAQMAIAAARAQSDRAWTARYALDRGVTPGQWQPTSDSVAKSAHGRTKRRAAPVVRTA
jgi:hypothetical protein